MFLYSSAAALQLVLTVQTLVLVLRVQSLVSDSRGFATDLAMVPLFAVGEVFLVSAFDLLHRTDIGSEREETGKQQVNNM